MSNVFGRNFRVELFGESHAAAVGVVIDGIPAGMEIDMVQVAAAMKRRAPSGAVSSTQRREADEVEVLCGMLNGRATGTPLCGIIRNTDTRAADYEKMKRLMRPGHADYTGHVKYKGANDVRGGGHFSARLTAPLVFAGSIARQYLAEKGIAVGARISRIADVRDDAVQAYNKEVFEAWEQSAFPVANAAAGEEMLQRVERARREKDSVGGVVECAIAGMPAGVGEPFFGSVESELSRMMFSIPAVKGIEFGSGFSMAGMRGSEANDSPRMQAGGVTFATNHSGGIMGGITNGMPVVFRVAVRPTPSIGKTQHTVDIDTMRDSEIEIEGRHDACVVPRAVEVVKSCAAIAVMDLYLDYIKHQGE